MKISISQIGKYHHSHKNYISIFTSTFRAETEPSPWELFTFLDWSAFVIDSISETRSEWSRSLRLLFQPPELLFYKIWTSYISLNEQVYLLFWGDFIFFKKALVESDDIATPIAGRYFPEYLPVTELTLSRSDYVSSAVRSGQSAKLLHPGTWGWTQRNALQWGLYMVMTSGLM